MSRHQTKAAHYIQSLDEARCSGDWSAVPELVRKIRKHAPERVCLTLTAECEHAVAQYSFAQSSIVPPSRARPSTATPPQPPPIAKYIPQLLSAVENERVHVEDAFQAQVCLGWVHWHIGEPALAAGRLPKNIEDELAQLDGPNRETAEWTKVCALKASYVKGIALGKTGEIAEALESFESGLPVFTAVFPKQRQWKELRTWMELFLTGFCMLSGLAIKSKLASPLDTDALSAFRAWGKFSDAQGPAVLGGRAPQAEVPRRHVWREYYTTLSDLLQQELTLQLSHPPANTQTSNRHQQRVELKLVEAKYEAILLSELQFPKAENTNQEVEDFLEIVMQNWRILCGSNWKDQDLGDGGTEAISRGVLDILYRAATKTFHSTAILRHLFQVHLAIAEFDLAFKAFDTYMEIIKKGKARIDKTGETEPTLDDDETVLKTASQCIQALCRYGTRQGAEKAQGISQYFEDWLDKYHAATLENENPRSLENGDTADPRIIITPTTLALAWRSIGISHAQWARLTFDPSSRSDIQLSAIKCFRKSLTPQYESTTNVDTLFALGTILAERRELAAAVEVVKFGLQPPESQSHALGSHISQFARERTLIPLWHLMALLLSARQEFLMATRSCEGAFEQFQDPKNLFGNSSSYRSDHLNENSSKVAGVVDEMDDFERQHVLEVKITQVTLIEVLEGPEVAVNSCGELLSLYSRLFGDPSKDVTAPLPSTTTLEPPRSSSGTIRSLKGSIFGRSARKSLPVPAAGEKPGSLHRSQTIQTVASQTAPTIQVTNENGREAKQHLKKESRHEKQKRSESMSRRKASGTIKKQNGNVGGHNNISVDTGPTPRVVDNEEFSTPPADSQEQSQWANGGQRASQVGLAISPDNTPEKDPQVSTSQPLPPKSQQMPHKENSLQPANSDPQKAQDNRLPNVNPNFSSTSPVTRFPAVQQRQRRVAILVKVWLLISGLYRRAAMYDDARGAIEEAHKLVHSVDAEASIDTTGSLSVSYQGWGGGKSVKELWADVYSERASLAVAESLPYVALDHFESALTHFVDHPSAIVGLSNILAGIYTEDLLPPPSITPIANPDAVSIPFSTPVPKPPVAGQPPPADSASSVPAVPHSPLGMSPSPPQKTTKDRPAGATVSTNDSPSGDKGSSATLQDRLVARDRAYGLLSTLTKLGTGWNNSEAWFALARSYELCGQLEKSRECLWWTVELEEARGVRDWGEVVGGMARGGYVL